MTSDNKYLSLCVLILTFLTHHVEHEKPFKGKTASEFEKAQKLVLKTYLFTLVKDQCGSVRFGHHPLKGEGS